MRIDWWTLGLQTINLLVLLWLLGRFLFRPMADMVAKRQADAARLLDEAETARQQALAGAEAAKDEQKRTAAARANVLDQARQEAEAQQTALIEAARTEAAAQRAAASTAIAQERAETQAKLENEASMLAADIAARLLQQPAAQLPLNAFLAQLEHGLAALPETARNAIAANGSPVTLTSAQKLDASAQRAVGALVEKALGRAIHITFTVDAALIAGLRLESGMAQVDANLRTELDQMRAELTRHDG